MSAMSKINPSSPLRRRVLLLAAGALVTILPRHAVSQNSPRPVSIVALGDSLTAGYNLPAPEAFPNVLERELRAKGRQVSIQNAGVSGDTASGGRDRLDWSVPDGTDLVIVSLGANDALRGIEVSITTAALDAILMRLAERKIPALLAGMLAPPNNGAAYGAAFQKMYVDLAKKHELPLYPFFLDGVAGNASLNLPDQLHPNAAGVREMVRRIMPIVEARIDSLPAKR
jgi:acyl-CoA thioesterase I